VWIRENKKGGNGNPSVIRHVTFQLVAREGIGAAGVFRYSDWCEGTGKHRKSCKVAGQVVHHDVELNRFEWQNIYAQLFEFVHFFHHKHLKSELHREIAKENWPVEARLILYFRQNFIVYNGVEMHKANPRDILDGQRIDCLIRDLTLYRRIPLGSETMWGTPDWSACPDCGAQKGQFHTDACDIEGCPNCHCQLLSCDCLSGGGGADASTAEVNSKTK
jgi:hypothetical protein